MNSDIPQKVPNTPEEREQKLQFLDFLTYVKSIYPDARLARHKPEGKTLTTVIQDKTVQFSPSDPIPLNQITNDIVDNLSDEPTWSDKLKNLYLQIPENSPRKVRTIDFAGGLEQAKCFFETYHVPEVIRQSNFQAASRYLQVYLNQAGMMSRELKQCSDPTEIQSHINHIRITLGLVDTCLSQLCKLALEQQPSTQIEVDAPPAQSIQPRGPKVSDK